MNTRHFPIFCILLLLAHQGYAQGSAPPTVDNAYPSLTRCSIFEAIHHMGDPASVRGLVREIYTSAKGMVMMTFGGSYPDQVFSVIIPDTRGFGSFKNYRGATIEVTGKITSYRGRPEIVVTSRRQILFRESAADPTRGGMGGP